MSWSHLTVTYVIIQQTVIKLEYIITGFSLTSDVHACSTERALGCFFLGCDAFRFQLLLSAVFEAHPEHQNMSLFIYSEGGIYLFLIWQPVIFRHVSSNNMASCIIQTFQKRRRSRKEIKKSSWLGPVCIFSVCINQGEPKLAKFSPLSGPVSQITSLL